MVTLVDLPTEIMLMIIECFPYRDSTGFDDLIDRQQDLCSFIKTNKRFYTLSRDRLYKENDRFMNQTALAYGAFHGDLALVRRTLQINHSRLTEQIPSWKRRHIGSVRHEPICWAAAGGQTAMIACFLQVGVSLTQNGTLRTICPDCETSLLGQAAAHGHLQTMKFLVDKGLRIESQREMKERRRRGLSALRMAAENGHTDCIDFILDSESYSNLQAKEYVHRITCLVSSVLNPPTNGNHDRIECALHLLKRSNLTEKRDFCACISESAKCFAGDLPALNETLAKPGRFELYAEMLLYLGVISGNLALLNEMARLGVSVETRYRGGHTPLCLAALEGGAHCAAMLLQLGADINAKNAKDQSPLFLAVLSKSHSVTELLLRCGADVNGCSTRCGIVQTPLWRTVADQVRCPDVKRNKNTPSRAGRSTTDEILTLLLVYGADPNYRDPTYGINPLWLAVTSRFKHSDPEMIWNTVETLIIHGANLRFSRRKRSILWESIHNCTSLFVTLLYMNGSDPNDYGDGLDTANPYQRRRPLSALAKSMKLGRFDIAEALLNVGADPHAQFWKKETCLVKAASFGPVSLVERLLDGGVDVNEIFRGKTALDIAVWRGKDELKELLLRRGAVPNIAIGGEGTAPIDPSHGEAMDQDA